MDVRRVRTEFLRFGLLVTLTVALLTVAFRIGDDGTQRPTAGRHHPAATATPSTGSSTGSGTATPPGTGTGSPAAPTDGSTNGSANAGAGGGNGSGGGTDQGNSSTGATAGASTTATLPRTGSAQIARLSAVAALLIGSGAWTVSISRPPTRRRASAKPG